MQDDFIPERIKPLEERILEVMSSITQWDFRVVKGYFPNEHDKGIYRALKKLEDGGQIRLLGWQGRTKQFTTKGLSNLPTIPVANGARLDIKAMFPFISAEYTEDYAWKKLARLNNFPILIGQIFTTAQLDNEEEFRKAYRDLLEGFSDYINELRGMLEQAESVRNHAIMSGDTELFKSLVLSSMPTQDEMTNFKIWLSKLVRSRNEEQSL